MTKANNDKDAFEINGTISEQELRKLPNKTPHINLLSDYNYAAHPHIIKAITTNLDNKYDGYGVDIHTNTVQAKIRELICAPHAIVQLLMGGTQTNMIAAAAFLRSHEAIIAAASAHIAVHETGAIEATGHKVLTATSTNGKLNATDVSAIYETHTDEHMVKPKMVFISQSTECGTVYTLDELIQLRAVCDTYDLLLYIDGARLAPALCARVTDTYATLPQIAQLADAFYIGGTKNGLLLGEALVICNPCLQNDFRYLVKQRGALMAKGFLLGIQFEAFFHNDLYLQLASTANAKAYALYSGLKAQGYEFVFETQTNQVFPIVSTSDIKHLTSKVLFIEWGLPNDHPAYIANTDIDADKRMSAIRFVTSYNTTDDEIDRVLELMHR